MGRLYNIAQQVIASNNEIVTDSYLKPPFLSDMESSSSDFE
jgi:hypothetical protein